MSKSSSLPQIQHLKSTASLGCKLDLSIVAAKTPKIISVEYNDDDLSPRTFLVMEMHKYKTKAQIYSSGKMIVYGGTSPSDAKSKARKYARIIQKIGFPIQFQNFKLANMTATHKFGFKINLPSLVQADHERMSHNPDAPMLVYRPQGVRIVVMIYRSGKIVFQKVKSHEQLMETFRTIEILVKHHQLL